ncbi:hypothetical protein TIFTF001_044884 [Ficus carica]|uniref:MATH domain-containing protein n=1 Tax=Ficus carica TaxID=3494 RepID=A0AA88CXG1_FICCA|nr:hypothetical protein TIFTF001_044884 [Ficus carica]
MYLDVADAKTLPSGWSKYAQFSLSIIDQTCGLYSVRKETQHVFNAKERDWGFTSFISLTKLHSFAGGFILQDKCIVEAKVTLKGVDKQELKRREEAEECPDTVIKGGELNYALGDFLFEKCDPDCHRSRRSR